MGKRPDLTYEEAEFYFDCFGRGLPNSEIALDRENTEFPLRQHRFIKRLKMEFDVAAKVLDAKIRQEADPIIIEQKKSHNKRLTNIAVDLLANDLDSVVQFMTPDGPYEYAIGDRLGLKYEITRDQLSALLSENEEATAIQHISRRLEQFKKHLEEEVKYKYPDLSSYDFNSIWAKCPYEIIDTLRLIADGNPPRGKCPVCEDWK